MANSIEGRMPFLDNDVIDFALSLPDNFLIDLERFKEKHIIHKAFDSIIPKHMKGARKKAYHGGYTWDEFSESKRGKDLWNYYLSSEVLRNSDVFNPSFIKTIKILNSKLPKNHILKCKTDLLLGNVFTTLVILDEMKAVYNTSLARVKNSDSEELLEMKLALS
jgi:asparagine synthetase B (glutamine-hydrolysing)